jgi:hypothetical protein
MCYEIFMSFTDSAKHRKEDRSEGTEKRPTADSGGDESDDDHVAALDDHRQAGQEADAGKQTVAAF